MQASGILYDRSSDGEYFHIYTERSPTGCLRSRAARRGYDAYGALDAPARIASQAQQPSERDGQQNRSLDDQFRRTQTHGPRYPRFPEQASVVACGGPVSTLDCIHASASASACSNETPRPAS